MDKPIVLIREETKRKLADVINESGLPAFVIEPILADFLSETRMVAQQQYEMEKMRYEKALETEKAKESETNMDDIEYHVDGI